MKVSFSKITFEQFIKLLGTMNNAEFCNFINCLLEVCQTDYTLFNNSKMFNGKHEWECYFIDDDGTLFDENMSKVIDKLNKFKNDYDFSLLTDENEIVFYGKDNFKKEIMELPIVRKCFEDKDAWANEKHTTGYSCDCYQYIMEYCDISVLF